MPAIAIDNAAPSTLATVIGQVIDAFNQAGDATPIKVGGDYREWFGAGSGPKVLFVPEVPGAGGKLSGATATGNPASQVHACDVFVRVPERSEDDLSRFDDLYALNDFVIDLVSTAGTGRLTWGGCADDSPLRVPSGLGCALGWSFTYQRDVRHDARRWPGTPRNTLGALIGSPVDSAPDLSPPFAPTSPAAVVGTVAEIILPTPLVE